MDRKTWVLQEDAINPETGEIVAKKGEVFTSEALFGLGELSFRVVNDDYPH